MPVLDLVISIPETHARPVVQPGDLDDDLRRNLPDNVDGVNDFMQVVGKCPPL